MAIRPVDMQAIMPRALEASRTNANDGLRPAAEQQQFAQQVQKNVNTEQQSVIQSNKTEGQTVDRDGRNAGGGQYTGGRRKNKGGGQDASAKDKEKKSLLDISL